MDDLTYSLRQLCQRNRDGSYTTQADRMRSLSLAARQLREAGFAAEITSDWPLDDFGGGDIALRTHPEEDQFAARDLIEFEED